MEKIKLRRGMTVGALDAVNDELLNEAFVDTGVLERLLSPSDPAFLVIGRTGSGKTALLKQLARTASHSRTLDPEQLCMQHLHNSQILQYLTSLKINLEIFYKYLWRHVCVLEISRLRYGDADPPGFLKRLFFRKEARAQEAAVGYLAKHSNFWITSERCVENVVEVVSTRLEDEFGAGFATGNTLSMGGKTTGEKTETRTISVLDVPRVQEIVSSVLLSDLNSALEQLRDGGFANQQQHYFLLIDDLDKNWMHDDGLYLALLTALLNTVRDINHRFDTVKVVVALRENIFHRLFLTPTRGPQREKWTDYIVQVQWTREELTELLQRRVAEVYRREYTKKGATIESLLPKPGRGGKLDPLGYLLERTLDRPRDVIRFVNMAIETAVQQGAKGALTWPALRATESAYSHDRLQSLFDEWNDTFPSLPALCEIPRHLGARFRVDELDDQTIAAVYSHEAAAKGEWLSALLDVATNDTPKWRLDVLNVLVFVGLLAVRGPQSTRYAWDQPTPRMDANSEFSVHRVFRRALGVVGADED